MITDLTVGNPAKILWKFSVPMLLSTIFQQFYNIADSVIVGKFVSEEALAAVGASYPIVMIFMAIAIGSNIGSSVVISQSFGAKKYGKMKTAVNTSLVATIAVSLLLTAFGLIFCRGMLSALKTPGNIIADAEGYLNIYIAGLVFLFVYNIATGVFTALGDSKTPLYFLIASSLGNILLDLVFVINFKMGVEGVAWATFTAQGIAAVSAFSVLVKRLKKIKPEEKPVIFSWSIFGKIVEVVVPSILQQSFVSVGNLFIQAIVNSFGSSVIAGYSAAVKLNTFYVTSCSAFASGLSSYTAQNIGAEKPERIPKGFRVGMVMSLIVGVPFVIFYCFFGNAALGLFIKDAASEAISVGRSFLRIVSPFYLMIGVKLMSDSILRGAGSMLTFTISTFTDLIIRVILAYVFSGIIGTDGIWWSWPIGWIVATALSYGFYATGVWKRARL